MIDKNEFNKVLTERKRIADETLDNWDYGIEQCHEKILAMNAIPRPYIGLVNSLTKLPRRPNLRNLSQPFIGFTIKCLKT